MPEGILVLNAGSSSIKFAVFQYSPTADEPRAMVRGQVSDIGGRAVFTALGADGAAFESGRLEDDAGDHASTLRGLLGWIEGRVDLPDIQGIGHRVVHGGADFTEPVIVTDVVLGALDKLMPLAPHHQPHNVAAIRAVADLWPHVPQVACFDTAFHATQPTVARQTGLPRNYAEAGIRRYGFHGLSYDYVTRALPAHAGGMLPERLIALHLGNGASMCAILNGESIATTMGFSTVDGIAMATRSGAVDPGAMIEVMRRENLDIDGLEDLLYNRSGILGLSGLSADMRTLLNSDSPAAGEAVDYYCYRIMRELGSLAAALGGVDAVVFTGGVGANAAAIRKRICDDAGWLGIALDDDANDRGGSRITTSASTVAGYAFDTDEESVIAVHTETMLCGI